MEQIVKRTSSKLLNYKETRLLASILPLVDTNGSVEELTLILPGLALLQSLRTKYLVSWLVFLRIVKRVCHQWRTSAIPLKTSQLCDVKQEDLRNCTSQVNTNGSTTLQLYLQLPSSFCWGESQGKWRPQQLWPTMTLGWIGPTPKRRELLGIVGTWSTSCDLCNCLLFALCILDSVLQLSCVLLECVLYLVLMIDLASQSYKLPKMYFPLILLRLLE
jgi:hypothetical protein